MTNPFFTSEIGSSEVAGDGFRHDHRRSLSPFGGSQLMHMNPGALI
jgi:hypothetical protein